MFAIDTMLKAIFCILLSFAYMVAGIPAWQGPVPTGSNSIYDFVGGSTHIEAKGPAQEGQWSTPNYLGVKSLSPGQPGNLTVAPMGRPPYFFIGQSQLYQALNDTFVLPVNLLNTTESSGIPLQLAVGSKKEGVKGGTWSWHGTQLFYEQQGASNNGLFFSCQSKIGAVHIYTSVEMMAPPASCRIITLHSHTGLNSASEGW